jgi:hypothetical protein
MREYSSGVTPVLFLDESSMLDIGSCFVRGVDVAPGTAIPSDGDRRIDHSLEGFLFTCGPDHIRHPEVIDPSDPTRRFPLHGSYAGHRAVITHTENSGNDLFLEAEVPIFRADGVSNLLERQYHFDGSSGAITLRDVIINTSQQTVPVFHMYHINLAGLLMDDETRIEGDMLEGGGHEWRFGAEPGGVFCLPADIDGYDWAHVRLGPMKALGGKSLTVSFRSDTLPHLQIWRNQSAPANVIAIEPVSHRWVGRDQLEENGEFNLLKPGESRSFELRFSFR